MAEAELAEQRLVEAEIEITHVLVHVPVIQLKVAKKGKTVSRVRVAQHNVLPH